MLIGFGLPREYARAGAVFGIIAYGLWLHWFVAFHGLGLSRPRAAVMVVGVNRRHGPPSCWDSCRRLDRRRMSLGTSMASGMQAALLLARGRSDGLRLVEDDMAGAARSFWAAAICLPAFVCLRLLAWTGSAMPPHAGHVLALDLVSFGVGWCGFAVLSHRLVGAMGLGERWPRFIALWNWCNVVQYLLLVVFSIPGLLGAPALLDQAAQLFGLGWALWLEWFAFRLTLGIGTVAAAGLVALDVAIGVLLALLGAGCLAR